MEQAEQLHRWYAWRAAHEFDPLEVERTHVEPYLRWFDAMACGLLLDGSRVSEVCGIDIDDLAEERWHHTVTVHGKGHTPCGTRRSPRRSPDARSMSSDRHERNRQAEACM